MKKSKFTESQIIGILKEQEQGKKMSDICREYGISQPTFYQWKSKYSGLDVNQLKRVKELEAEVSQYKKLVAELTLDNRILKDLNSKNSRALRKAAGGCIRAGMLRNQSSQGL